MKALILDDSKTMRMIIGKILDELSINHFEAASGMEALRHLREETLPDLVMVDWNMPEMNGLDLVRLVREDSRFDTVRLIMITTETEMDNVAAALQAGANEYIMKPFNREVILGKLNLLGVDC